MRQFLDDEFLLYSGTASALYHTYAEKLPILDYHCHINPKEVADDISYSNITELWLYADHYKWRAMRSCGIEEKYITGGASDFDRFRAFASCMPKLIGNPIYHWVHLELKRYFGCDLILSEKTAEEIWELTSEKLGSDSMKARSIIKASNVELLCTTDDPCDSLEYHEKIAADSTFNVAVLPAFRPDRAMNIERKGIRDYLGRLSTVSGIEIRDIDSYIEALASRIDLFEKHGCRTADHGIDDYMAYSKPNRYSAGEILKKAIESDGADISEDELALFKCEVLKFLGGEYRKLGWVLQFHMGVSRNPNSACLSKLGPDTGFDTIHGKNCIRDLSHVLDMLYAENALPKTVIYSINPSDNAAVGALIGSYQYHDGNRIQPIHQGSAWWFNDNIEGMRAQMKSLANLSAFGNFLGMLTDSRSFTAYVRHEYFRRILCDLIGGWVENGEYPADPDSLGQLVCDICYNNTKDFFGFKLN
ncbi:MAG: glucuronate isomerase [Clostridia bacterium]|nr:glucuronate isomerase [Clostridia bacterium]